MFECEKCKGPTKYLVASRFGVCCPACCEGNGKKKAGWVKVMAGNKYDRKMSYADQQHIVARRLSPDGKSVIKDPKWA